MKKNVIKILLVVVLLISIGFRIYSSYNNNTPLESVIIKENKVNKKQFAMYREEILGNYEELKEDTFPKYSEGYILNLEKSKCINYYGDEVNGLLSYDKENDKVIVDSDNTSYCYLYFDIRFPEPEYSSNLIPVVIEDNGTVKKADTTQKWYDYANKEWANAVMLTGSDTYTVGATIPESAIKAYFVWIPKYSYKIFDMGNYTTYSGTTKPSTSIAKEIKIKFGMPNTTDTDTSCATPMTSGSSGNCTVGKWMTHPAFISMNSNGLWVAKFETTGAINALTSKPGITSLRNQTVKAMFDASYNYSRDNDSHMMKNTEWGAVAYLSHSVYGINTEIRINNNSDYKTGYAAVDGTDQSKYLGTYGNTAAVTQPYNTTTGYKASTTGNITGIYDMSGGAHDYMASFDSLSSSGFTDATIGLYAAKYYERYTNLSQTRYGYYQRILGDATGEMGPFYMYVDGDNTERPHNNWYSDISFFVNNSWFVRGGAAFYGSAGGQFTFHITDGSAQTNHTIRLVLTK